MNHLDETDNSNGRPIISAKPLTLPAPGRATDLQVKVSAPTQGQDLPIILFSHGFGSNFDGYGPLIDYWAAHGFVVVQPTYLDSRRIGVPPTDTRAAQLWRYRVEDAKRVLDNLDVLEAAVPGLSGRMDRGRIAAVGHSFGGQTSGVLLGLRVLAPAGEGEDMSDSRVRAGILLGTAGAGEGNLADGVIDKLPWLNVSFAHMTAPVLVVAGDHDQSLLTVRGPDWSEDPYTLSPGPKSLLTVFGAEHSLGGIPGYDAKETTDENQDVVDFLQSFTLAYLRHALGINDADWSSARIELQQNAQPLGKFESK
ncbi:chlorophyllase [Rhodococcus sp. G-MC3]|uniref:alpha/beta hydrolase family protein n=1 Tax=Rhodococcus sp. G-MC3 TaxID=3046209 RepID=UPI0024BA3A55|nr:chlorophyllase [Rhodococcus sp. G-MC3]MDJ0396108.1 chlorophyllase [Rhodococcus sp. G-MC3]